jgi:hypothetical protein
LLDVSSVPAAVATEKTLIHIALQMSASTEGVSFSTSTGIKSLERQRAPQIRALEETGRPNLFWPQGASVKRSSAMMMTVTMRANGHSLQRSTAIASKYLTGKRSRGRTKADILDSAV